MSEHLPAQPSKPSFLLPATVGNRLVTPTLPPGAAAVSGCEGD